MLIGILFLILGIFFAIKALDCRLGPCETMTIACPLENGGQVLVTINFDKRQRAAEIEKRIRVWSYSFNLPMRDSHYGFLQKNLSDFEDCVVQNIHYAPPVLPSAPTPVPKKPTLAEKEVNGFNQRREAAEAINRAAGIDRDLTGSYQQWAGQRVEFLFKHPDNAE